ncbi:unnamed protein product, partial [Bubo scandiacus]
TTTKKENPWYPETACLLECRGEKQFLPCHRFSHCSLLLLITVSPSVHVEESFRQSRWGCSSGWEKETLVQRQEKSYISSWRQQGSLVVPV